MSTRPAVLILEDDARLLNLYVRVISSANCEVVPVMSMETAQAMLAQRHFEVFMSDIGIGNRRSLELLRREVNRLHQEGTNVVVVSGHEEAQAMCEELGIEFFLHKPVSNADLRTLITRLINRDR